MLVLPLILFDLFVLIAPQLTFARFSLFEQTGPGRVGDQLTAENFIRVLTDTYYYSVVAETFKLGAIVAVVTLFLAYPLAYKIARSDGRLAYGLLFLCFMSQFSDVVARTIGLRAMLSTVGLIPNLFRLVGLDPPQLSNNFTGAAIGLVYYALPILTLLLIPVIAGIDPLLERAAEGMGASPLQAVIQVTVPLSLPGIIGGCLLIFATAIGAYATPVILGGGRVQVLTTVIQTDIQIQLNYARGATLTVFFLGVALLAVASALILARRRVFATLA